MLEYPIPDLIGMCPVKHEFVSVLHAADVRYEHIKEADRVIALDDGDLIIFHIKKTTYNEIKHSRTGWCGRVDSTKGSRRTRERCIKQTICMMSSWCEYCGGGNADAGKTHAATRPGASGSSCMRGNSHVQFLGGDGLATAPSYPVMTQYGQAALERSAPAGKVEVMDPLSERIMDNERAIAEEYPDGDVRVLGERLLCDMVAIFQALHDRDELDRHADLLVRCNGHAAKLGDAMEGSDQQRIVVVLALVIDDFRRITSVCGL